MSDVFEALLEKKGRGRSAFAISRPWAVRTFRLSGQTLEYFDVDKLKGSVDVRDGVCKLVSAEEADNKPFPFELDVGKEKILLNAPNEMIRKKCMEVFTAASKDPNWLANSRYSLNRASVQTQQKIDNLEVYQQKLEQELQQQQTTATLAILQEQAIQKDLRGAAEAERKQQEQQVIFTITIHSSTIVIPLIFRNCKPYKCSREWAPKLVSVQPKKWAKLGLPLRRPLLWFKILGGPK